MKSVFTAETTVLFHLKSVRVIFLIFDRVVVSLLAFAASECNLYSHIGTSVIFCEKSRLPLDKSEKFAQRGRIIIPQTFEFVKCFVLIGIYKAFIVLKRFLVHLGIIACHFEILLGIISALDGRCARYITFKSYDEIAEG